MGWKTFILPEIKLRQEEAFLKKRGVYVIFTRVFLGIINRFSMLVIFLYWKKRPQNPIPGRCFGRKNPHEAPIAMEISGF